METFRSEAFQRAGYAFDIFCVCSWNDGYDGEIARLGGSRTSCLEGRSHSLLKKLLNGVRGFNCALVNGKYDVVHVNVTNGLGLVYTWLAKQHGIPIRIAHAHNASFADPGVGGIVKRIGHLFGRVLFSSSPTRRIACSDAAGRFSFGLWPFDTVVNGIDSDRFRFDAVARAEIRDELGAPSDAVIIGGMGRIDEGKNPIFLVNVFSKYHQKHQNSMCVLVGSGALENAVRAEARRLGIDDALVLVPATTCPERYYAAFDVLVMPSVSEGFGIAAVEAQCSGLPVVSSDALSEDVRVATDILLRLSLTLGVDGWVHALESVTSAAPLDRARWTKVVAGSQLDCQVMAQRFCSLYEDGAC